MDYHFLKPQGLAPNRGYNSGNALKILGRFLPLFLLAAILPFLIGMVVAPPNIGFLTRADEPAILRVWLEPANMLLSPGSTGELTVISQFDGEGRLIPEISLTVAARGGVVISGEKITHSIPYEGRVELGKVYVRGVSSGEAVVSIPKEDIRITAFSGPLEINTGDAKVIVRQ